jgi:hypothetical protein
MEELDCQQTQNPKAVMEELDCKQTRNPNTLIRYNLGEFGYPV